MTVRHRERGLLAKRLDSFRSKRYLSRDHVAKQAGISPHLLQSLEQGRTANPRLSTLLGLAKVYDVTVDNLIDGIQLTELQEQDS